VNKNGLKIISALTETITKSEENSAKFPGITKDNHRRVMRCIEEILSSHQCIDLSNNEKEWREATTKLSVSLFHELCTEVSSKF
jgi:hypothetical protein